MGGIGAPRRSHFSSSGVRPGSERGQTRNVTPCVGKCGAAARARDGVVTSRTVWREGATRARIGSDPTGEESRRCARTRSVPYPVRTMPAAGRPRAIWTGSISFGLVNAPVRMYAAVSEQNLKFNLIHEKDGGRIGYQKICKLEDEDRPQRGDRQGLPGRGGRVHLPHRRGLRGRRARGVQDDHRPRLRADVGDRPDLLRAHLLPGRRRQERRAGVRAAGRGDGAGRPGRDRDLRLPRAREPRLPARPRRRAHPREDVLPRRGAPVRGDRARRRRGRQEAAGDGAWS